MTRPAAGMLALAILFLLVSPPATAFLALSAAVLAVLGPEPERSARK